jgi:hypothetical protein
LENEGDEGDENDEFQDTEKSQNDSSINNESLTIGKIVNEAKKKV